MAEKRAGDQAPRIGCIVTADRVTAIEAAIVDRLERSFVEGARTIAKLVMRTPALLEALSTIDRLEGELADEREKCPMRLIHYGPAEHEHQWVKRGVQGMGLDFLGEKCSVCGAVQALNGGNE